MVKKKTALLSGSEGLIFFKLEKENMFFLETSNRKIEHIAKYQSSP